MEQKKIALVGYGAMGKRIAAAIQAHEGWELCGVIDPLNEECLSSLSLLPEKPHVVIDFSHPANLEMILSYCREQEVACVLSTTGFSPAQEAMCRELSAYAPVVRTQNTSLGINIMEEILRTITPILKDRFDIEIIEKHHNKKIDAPSGTALLLADAVKAHRPDAEYVFGRHGQHKRQPNEIGIHSLRMGNVVGEHEVIFSTDSQTITLKHQAHDRALFAEGALTAAGFLVGKPAGLYHMDDLLG